MSPRLSVVGLQLIGGTMAFCPLALGAQTRAPAMTVDPEPGEAHLARIRQLTNGGENAEAYFSQDGKRLIFQSTRDGRTCDQQYIMNVDGTGVRRVSNGRGKTTCGYFMDGDLDIYVMNVDGTHVRRLTNQIGYDGGAWWSPDGKRIVYRAYHPTDEKDLASYKDLLAQRLVRPNKMDLWIMDADGGNQRQLTHLGAASFGPSWTPDGTKIIFSSNHHTDPKLGNFDLFLIKPDGSGLEQITTAATFDGFPMFRPDGKSLVWASNRHDANPHETNLFIADWRN
jgi:TolB protein